MLDIKLKFTAGHTGERDWMAPAPLRQLFWNVTYACNFRCPICFTSAGRASPRELSTAEARDMVDLAHAAGVRDIIISGGEPFLRPDLPDVLSHMADRGMTARIASNGSLLTDRILDRLRRDTLTTSFQISVDALDPQVYAHVHGTDPQMLRLVLDNVRRVREHGFHTTVSARLTPATLPGLRGLLDRCCEEGWATLTVHCPLHTGRAGGAFPQDIDALELLRPALDHFCGLPQRWVVETYIPWAPYHPVIRELEGRVPVVHRGCPAGRDRLTVQPTGALTPCVCMDFPQAVVGDMRRDDLAEVFRASPLCRLLRRPRDHGLCSDCAHAALCGAGCRAAAYGATGSLTGADVACPVRRALDAETQPLATDTRGQAQPAP